MGIKTKKFYIPQFPDASDREIELQNKVDKLNAQLKEQSDETQVTTSSVKPKGAKKDKR